MMTAEELKRDYKLYLNKIKSDIPEVLKDGRLKRGVLIERLVERSPLSDVDKLDLSASAVLAQYKSIIGTAIKRMEQYGDLEVNEHGEIALKKKPQVIAREAEISRYIIEQVKDSALTLREITDRALDYFGASKTLTLDDDVSIEIMVRHLTSDLVRRKKLSYSYGKYTLSPETIVIKKPKSLFEEFIILINSKGGEFFENYSAILLDKYYRSIGMRVGYCNVIGGSDDGGIDVILTVSDQLGFEDKILVQCKQKSGTNVTLKELKEFVGAFYVDKGTRGIYMTTARFHKEASLLFNDLHNIIPIDGAKLFDIAKKCQCGVKLENGEYKIDREFFFA